MVWLLSINCRRIEDVFYHAAGNGNVENMNWLLKNINPPI